MPKPNELELPKWLVDQREHAIETFQQVCRSTDPRISGDLLDLLVHAFKTGYNVGAAVTMATSLANIAIIIPDPSDIQLRKEGH